MPDRPSEEEISSKKRSSPEEHAAVDGSTNDAQKNGENSGRRALVPLKSGEALTAQEAFSITAASRTRLLVIAGAVGSGKTTLIASIFHRFQKGSFAGYYFAGSDTLIGFDERSYLARIAPEREVATTKRTIPGISRNLLHLRVRKPDLRERASDLLFIDLSGEDYEEFKDSPDECRRFAMIARADHLIVLVDGSKLVDPAARQGAKRNAGMLLQSCIDSEQLGRHSQVDIIISKWDLVDMAADKAAHSTYIDGMKRWLTQLFAPRLRRLRFFEVVARREKGPYEIAHGLSMPFKSWVEDLPVAAPGDCPQRSPQELACEFDRYWGRRLCGNRAGA